MPNDAGSIEAFAAEVVAVIRTAGLELTRATDTAAPWPSAIYLARWERLSPSGGQEPGPAGP